MPNNTTPNYGTRAPGAVGGIQSDVSSYWQELIKAFGDQRPDAPQLSADQNGNRFVLANGGQVFVLPDENGKFTSKLYLTTEDLVAKLSTLSPGETKVLEKNLGLKPTGMKANPSLVQRYISEANKASVNNVATILAQQNGSIKSFSQRPLNPIEQAQISIKTGDIAGGGTRTSRSVSVAQFSAGDAQAILEQFYADTLGRRPKKSEVKKFNDLINKQAKKQPSVSTTTYGADGSSTTMSGGAGYSQADAQMAARQMAESDPEASAFLTSTRYMDAFMNAIGSQV